MSGAWKIRVASLDSTRVDEVIEADSNAEYPNGFLFFVRSGTLLAQRFEERTLRLAGEPVPLAERILHDANLGRAVFSVSGAAPWCIRRARPYCPPGWSGWIGTGSPQVRSMRPVLRLAASRSAGPTSAVTVTHPGTANANIRVYHLAGSSQSATYVRSGVPTGTQHGRQTGTASCSTPTGGDSQ